jgi:TatA/E family protein of Tat protein translocase
MFGIGAQEMVFIAIIALLVFGPKRLPELARTIGRGLAEFRHASSDLRSALSLEPDPPGTPKKRKHVDPREDRDFDEPAPQSALHESIIADVKAAEAAVAAELADEANDEKHRADGGPTAPEEGSASASAEAEPSETGAGAARGAEPDVSSTSQADTEAPSHDGPPGTTPVAAPRPGRQD